MVAQGFDFSKTMVQRFSRLTKLILPILQIVDEETALRFDLSQAMRKGHDFKDFI